MAQLPREALLAGPHELAKRWLVALILARPLEGVVDLPIERLAREAPALCAQLLDAIESDAALARLLAAEPPDELGQPAPAPSALAGIAGARDAGALVQAVEALRGVLWDALRARAEQVSAREAGEIADRLAEVCAAMLARALETAQASAAGGAGPASAVAQQGGAGGGAVLAGEARARDNGPGARRGAATIVDEGAPAHAPAEEPVPARASARSAPASLHPPRSSPMGAPPAPASGEIEIHDQRGEEGPAAWIGAIGGELERFARDHAPFAVLLVELAELERLRHDVPAPAFAALCTRVEQALAGQLEHWPATITRERPGRCWVLVRDADGAGVRRLCELLAAAAAASASHGGAPLRVAIGHALCPQDAREAAALAAHADVGLYAARAALRARGAGTRGATLEG